MSKREKLLQRFLSVPEPSDFTWSETMSLMESLDFEWRQSSGSHGRFVYLADPEVSIMLCRPHPTPVLKRWAIRQLKEQLRLMELI
ncbi:type II toxin-antitoxin system HicA family toxin [Parasutterella sp.]|jgi:hypothetical protein|uniref:type II toxin-antitoxin system HicA family toxin n=2 Tax=Parasutterella sp. TaxID=2049037 RepID=UPI0020666A18|nr:MAG TPA: HICA protein [Caudoviricetes sp.]DAT52953.1 MAG TPA: HICA protein [Caudoviricetes sp.]DAY47928.1 MAG TPA: HICA protein [Caudoviricetes sp.]